MANFKVETIEGDPVPKNTEVHIASGRTSEFLFA